MSEDYAPACRKEVGALALPDGDAYYAYRVRVFTTTEKTPDEIHQLGLSEVARIRAAMMEIISDVEFDGDFKAFQNFLRTDPQFYAKTPEELVAATSVIAKKADGAIAVIVHAVSTHALYGQSKCQRTSQKARRRRIMSGPLATAVALGSIASIHHSWISARYFELEASVAA